MKTGPLSSKYPGCTTGQATPIRKVERFPQAISREVTSSIPAPTIDVNGDSAQFH